MIDDGEVTRIELGGGRRRWWPIVVAVLVAWVVAAVALGGGGDDDPAAAPSSTTTSTSPPTTSAPGGSTTTTTAPAPGTPLLGRETGWHLVVGPTDGTATNRVIDLDTGVESSHPGVLFGPPRPDGVFTQDRRGRVFWRPFPFTEGSEVFLTPAVDGRVFPVAGTDGAWLVLGQSAAVNDARLFSLVDGAPLASVELPVDSFVVGVAADALVVAAGGDLFAVGADGGADELSTGQAVAVLRDEVLVSRCDEQLRCGVVATDVATGSTRAMPDVPGGASVFAVGPAHPDGRIVVHIGDPRRPLQEVVLLGPDGAVPLLPEGVAVDHVWGAAWSPDGALLFVPGGGEVDVVDPFADGGPRVVASIPVHNVLRAQLAVVQPRSED